MRRHVRGEEPKMTGDIPIRSRHEVRSFPEIQDKALPLAEASRPIEVGRDFSPAYSRIVLRFLDCVRILLATSSVACCLGQVALAALHSQPSVQLKRSSISLAP